MGFAAACCLLPRSHAGCGDCGGCAKRKRLCFLGFGTVAYRLGSATYATAGAVPTEVSLQTQRSCVRPITSPNPKMVPGLPPFTSVKLRTRMRKRDGKASLPAWKHARQETTVKNVPQNPRSTLRETYDCSGSRFR